MKKHYGRIIGDVFFYCFVAISIICIIAILVTPARGFVWKELQKLQDIRGQVEGPQRFMKKLNDLDLKFSELTPQLLIRKRSRQMLVLSDNLVIATYPVGIGKNPVGIKLNGKDGKTPEGQYYVCKKDDAFHFHLFLQLNYPSPDDAKRGSVQRLINHHEETAINESWNLHLPPPADTALGGPLGIHGFGAESNWTDDGSISMHNAHLEEIYWLLATGTPVAIVP